MHLDTLTLFAMGSFVAACAGVMLLGAWWQNRKIPALALWGVADIITALGIISLTPGPILNRPAGPLVGIFLLTLAAGLIWKAARSFDGKPASLLVAVFGAMLVALIIAIPATRHTLGWLSLAINTIYLFAAATTLLIGREERLAARWPLIILMSVHAGVLLIGACSTLNGSLHPGEVPPVMSLFGIVHFEGIVFTLGTAIFILALVNERNEAASRMAARVDPLTGIANRAAFMDGAARIVERCRRENLPVSVLMCDLDRFKAINDTHGHAVGDAVIRKFCDVVTALLRPNDVFGRLGGEEFAVVLPRSGIGAACARADRIRAAFAENCRAIEDHEVAATVSCGVATSRNAELKELLELSDLALYRAKAEGRNRVRRADQLLPEGSQSNIIRVA
jgi:diguanylate cyclase (GGDEF)-like protein